MHQNIQVHPQFRAELSSSILRPSISCRIVIFHLTSIRYCVQMVVSTSSSITQLPAVRVYDSAQNCRLLPHVHRQSSQNCHLLPLVHRQFCAELSSSTSCPFHNCRKAGAGDGGEVHRSRSSSSQWRPRRMLPPKPGPRNPKFLLLHLVCLFLLCLPSSFFGFFMVWSFSDHVVSSVLYISW
jgi:hypothetical protein